ncbi:endonuclease/exonuclease/phosphatase family protein [Alloscardovia venturai]|uniref:Endonuclease/exonuclease/phosphatase family protein n=1 Tax=Alloscardovia venturai TaxID=1769421 RepID=A0ABW2Y2Z2_9BIFI
MIIWIALVLIAAWMCLRYLPAGMDAKPGLPQLIALIPLLAVPLVALGIMSLILRNGAQAIVVAILLLIHLAWSATFFVPMTSGMTAILGSPRQTITSTMTSTTAGQPAQTLTVMTINTRYGRADTGTIMHEIQQNDVDILAVSEANDDFIKRLHDSGILLTLTNEQLGTQTNHDNAGFNAIWSRYPVVSGGGSLLGDMGSNTPWCDVNVNDHTVRILSTHPYSPQRGVAQWEHDIAELPRATEKVATPVIVMGDMNSSTFHPSLRKVINSGLLDSSLELHKGAHTTFPSSWPLVPPLIEIDHVLHTRELATTSIVTTQIPRTDHLALIATLEWK